MHPLLLYSSVLVGVVSAVHKSSSPSDVVNVTSVAGTIDSDHVSVVVPIAYEHDTEPLVIKLDVGSADRECLDINLGINNAKLTLASPSQQPTQFSSPRGDGSFAWLEASGSLTCLEGDVSLVVLTISNPDIDSAALTELAFSYRQTGQPSILRLSHGPALDAYTSTSQAVLDSWRSPSDELKLTVVPGDYDNLSHDMPPGLEAELLKLDLLKAHAADIEKEIKAVQASIMSIWKAQFSTCDTIRCYVKTAWKKAPTLAHLLATHVSHHTHINSDFFKNETHMNCTAEVKKVVEQHENQALLVDFSEDAETTEEADDDAVQAVEVETEVETTEVETTEEASEVKDKEDQQEEQGGNGRPQWHHGPPGNGRRPPWARPGGRPPWAGGRPPWARPNSRRPWAGGRPPWATEENHTPAASPPSDSAHPHSQSHFQPFALTPQDQFKIAFFIAAALIIGVGALTFGCCICIRRKCIFLRDPRRKADCAARREERRTRALYRKAACKYRVRTFFQRFRRPFASSDYEEKRELILNQESESADVVRPQINGLRNTHLLVREMMRAEEGSSSFQHQRTEGRAPAELEAAERASIRSETLPAYSLPPPSYANDLGSDFSVVDGFTGYTPSVTDGTPDDTTQSSVVDCSPRLSFDTQRTETTRSRE